MRQRLIALAAAVSALGAGAALFFNWETAVVERTIADTGSWEQIDRASCSTAACNTTQCNAAKDHLADAGSACLPRLVSCDFRVSNRMRSCFSDAGVALSSKKYQRIQVTALRCPAADGGNAFGVPFDDAGCPIFAGIDQARCIAASISCAGRRRPCERRDRAGIRRSDPCAVENRPPEGMPWHRPGIDCREIGTRSVRPLP